MKRIQSHSFLFGTDKVQQSSTTKSDYGPKKADNIGMSAKEMVKDLRRSNIKLGRNQIDYETSNRSQFTNTAP